MKILLHRNLASLHGTFKRVEAVCQLFDIPRNRRFQLMFVFLENTSG